MACISVRTRSLAGWLKGCSGLGFILWESGSNFRVVDRMDRVDTDSRIVIDRRGPTRTGTDLPAPGGFGLRSEATARQDGKARASATSSTAPLSQVILRTCTD
jgi:hypothetical protein